MPTQLVSNGQFTHKLSLHSDSYVISKQIESLWHQKSRTTWNLNGDRNTKFFHPVASAHSRMNLISEITVNQSRFLTPTDIKEQAFLFYRNLFKQSSAVEFSLDSLELHSLTDSQAASLSATFAEEEIYQTLLSLDDNKALGPDGFNFFFYKKAWHFRSISLINGIFKLLSKVLANRLSPLLPDIISANQFGFIRGRSIQDCHMIASEIFISLLSEKINISWDFILKMLVKFNFDSTWVKWIRSFFDTSQLSVLINGSPSKNFTMGKGVRQGDPLSPMLFVLAVEGLKAIISQSIQQGLFDGVHITCYEEPVSILQFADDTLLFIPNNLDMIRNLLRVLRFFEIISGLSINYSKSSLLGINIDEDALLIAAEILQCSTAHFPISYLGLPLSIKSVRATHWQPVVENFAAKLTLWKGKLLSPAGRLVLIKAVLNSLPVYYMGSFVIPQSIVTSLDRCMKRFLWCGNSEGKWFCKVAWSSNLSLLCKWLWKFRTSRGSLWFCVVTSSSGMSSWDDLVSSNHSHLSHQWKGILRFCVKNQVAWRAFNDSFSVRIGNGESASFWHDRWNQFSSVSQLLPSSAAAPSFSWNRRLRIGEQQLLLELLDKIKTIHRDIRIPDKFCWKGKLDSFKTRDISLLLQKNAGQGSSLNSPLLPFIWRWKLPPRVQFFGWLLARDRISSYALLAARVFMRKCYMFWVSPPMMDIFFGYWNSIPRSSFRELWRLIWFFGISELWKARNNRVFNSVFVTFDSLVITTIRKAVIFYVSFLPHFPYSGNDVIRHYYLFGLEALLKYKILSTIQVSHQLFIFLYALLHPFLSFFLFVLLRDEEEDFLFFHLCADDGDDIGRSRDQPSGDLQLRGANLMHGGTGHQLRAVAALLPESDGATALLL
ncbi:uncharacterized protein LOC126678581 [Mercurialis annua]|uniref:uncharacterized protein LOC126678581 n=1 Tax=Mercurialis annua TaxID=3986 RepID=UPI00215F6979|nr:uncharacterized protein LOC126678581 [Mercurialis annua]